MKIIFYFITEETEGQDSYLQTFHRFLSENWSALKHRGDKSAWFAVMYVGAPEPGCASSNPAALAQV